MDNNNEKSQIQITEDEQSEIAGLNAEFQNLLLQIGNNNIKKIDLKKQLSELKKFERNCKKSYYELKKREDIFADRLKAKYGDGVLDIESGIYIKS